MSSLSNVLNILYKCVHSLELAKAEKTQSQDEMAATSARYESPTFPPAPPAKILASVDAYDQRLRLRRYRIPLDATADTPLFALYRIYEYFLVDFVTGYRNQLEYFWRQTKWPISSIPDPTDDDPARYAFLAGTAKLLVRSYNEKIRMGFARDMPAIMSDEQIEYYQNRPEKDRTYEEVPQWAESVPPLSEPLAVKTHDGVVLDGFDDPRACKEFKALNILIWTPQIHFT